MKIVRYVLWIINFLIWKHTLGSFSTSSYYDGLVKYLKKESKLHQVMFILDDEFNMTNSMINTLIKSVNERFPTLSISTSKVSTNLRDVYLPSLNRPRRTTLFAFEADISNNKSFAKVKEALVQFGMLSKGSSLPKCLIVSSSNSTDVENKKFLELAWRNKFLDTTILFYGQEHHVLLGKKENKLPVLLKMNPFLRKYFKSAVSSKSRWFPDKLQNLHGHRLKLLLGVNDFNFMHKMIDARKFAQLLANAMNFSSYIQVIWMPNVSDSYAFLMKNGAEMWLNLIEHYGDVTQYYMNLRLLSQYNAKAVIPKITKFAKVVVVSKDLWYLLLGTIAITCFLRMTTYLLRFKQSRWQTLNISRIIMGTSVVEEPEKLAERIVFGSLIIACIVYTSYFYSAILEITLQVEPEVSTLEELALSSLTPMANPFLKNLMLKSSIPNVRQIAMKSVDFPGQKTVLECLQYLTEYQNVTCIDHHSEKFVNYYMAIKGEVNLKILTEPLAHVNQHLFPTQFSPYLDRFNEIILKATDCGLLEKVLYSKLKPSQSVSRPEEVEKEKILLISLYVLSIGYTLSIIAFLFEIVITFGTRVSSFLRNCLKF